MYPLVMTNIAIENGPVEIVGFPIKSGGSFQFAMLVYQRVKSLYSIIYGIIPLKMVISHSYVSLPEGTMVLLSSQDASIVFKTSRTDVGHALILSSDSAWTCPCQPLW